MVWMASGAAAGCGWWLAAVALAGAAGRFCEGQPSGTQPEGVVHVQLPIGAVGGVVELGGIVGRAGLW